MNMKSINEFKNKQISMAYTSKLYGGTDATVVITDPDPIKKETYIGMVITTSDGSKVKLNECSQTNENTVTCKGTLTLPSK